MAKEMDGRAVPRALQSEPLFWGKGRAFYVVLCPLSRDAASGMHPGCGNREPPVLSTAFG